MTPRFSSTIYALMRYCIPRQRLQKPQETCISWFLSLVLQRISELKGHSKQISGLAFSTNLNVLISCGVDTQVSPLYTSSCTEARFLEKMFYWIRLCCGTLSHGRRRKARCCRSRLAGWRPTCQRRTLNWTMISSTFWQCTRLSSPYMKLQHYDVWSRFTLNLRLRLHLRIYKILKMMIWFLKIQWTIANFCTRISHATYSCDSRVVYAAMRDGILLILGAADLAPRLEIDPSSYLPPHLR